MQVCRFANSIRFFLLQILTVSTSSTALSAEPQLGKVPVIRLPGEGFRGSLSKVTVKELEMAESLKDCDRNRRQKSR